MRAMMSADGVTPGLSPRWPRSRIVVFAAVLLGLTAPVRLAAQHGEEADVIHACLIPGTGTIYLIGGESTPPECVRETHILFEWHRVGPEGPAGPQGPSGPEGPEGPAGAEGANCYDGLTDRNGDGFTDVEDCVGQDGQDGGLAGYELLTDSTTWSAVDALNNTYDLTITCSPGKTALGTGIFSAGNLNNVLAMSVQGPSNNQGYFRIRIQASSNPQDVTAQLVCATIG